MINIEKTFDFSDQSLDSDYSTNKQLLLWVLNTLLLFFGLSRLLFHGDPVLPSDSRVFLEVERKRRQAEYALEGPRKDHDEASQELNQCLGYLSRRVHLSRTGVLLSTLWECLRQLFHRVYLDRLFGYFGRKDYVDGGRTAREISLVYHQILKTKLTNSNNR